MIELFTNSGDPDKTPRAAVPDLYLHYLPITRLGCPVNDGLSLRTGIHVSRPRSEALSSSISTHQQAEKWTFGQVG